MSITSVGAGEPLLPLGLAQPEVDRHRRHAREQAGVERDHEVLAGRQRDRHPPDAVQRPRPSHRGVA